ncbi:MAG TPA: DegT/DnrJ/EryC1/StrS family aminotransferase, partial [Terriglobia bacterium]|nr:DegT/DnrJ/EryC1/StrS family aminotransferase [Terriglobia bacterium]
SKNMTTGEGGMITTSHAALARELRLLRSHGEQSRYRHIRLGYNFRSTDIASALGRVQLAKLPAAVRARRQNAAFLARGLTGLRGLALPETAPDVSHAFNLFTVRIDPRRAGMPRDAFAEALERRGIQAAVHYPLPLHRQPIFRNLGRDRDFPVSARLAKSVLSLPVHPGLSKRDLHAIVQAVREILKAE